MRTAEEIRRDGIVHDLYVAQEMLAREILKERYGKFNSDLLKRAMGYAIFALEHIDPKQFFEMWEREKANNEHQ